MLNRSEFVIKIITDILVYLIKHEQEDLGMMNIVEGLPYNHRTIRSYITALEKEGLVQIEPLLNKNTVRLTNRGHAVAHCLLIGE